MDEIVLIVDRILKCNHPSLADGNKVNQYYNMCIKQVRNYIFFWVKFGDFRFLMRMITP